MLTFRSHLYDIAALRCFLFQGVSIDIEPVKRFANGVLILHSETMFTVIHHFIGNINHAIFGLEHIGSDESQSTWPPGASILSS